MDLFRFYCPSLSGSDVELTGSQAYHLTRVLRLAPADRVELFDGSGKLATATITKVHGRTVALQLEELQVLPRPFEHKIVIAVSIAKGERFDWLLSRCTELGVDRICPVLFERTVKQAKNPKIVQRWQNLAVAAAKQCRRLYLPHIDTPLPLPQVLKVLRQEHPDAGFLLGSISADAPSLFSQLSANTDIAAFVGPEGGITEDEQHLLSDHSVQAVHLTDTVLRVETAAIAFAAILTARRAAEKAARKAR